MPKNPEIRTAIDDYFADLDAVSLRNQVLARTRGETRRQRKLSVGLAVALVLMLAAVTAVAVTLLTAAEMVEQHAVPAAQGNDAEAVNETFSHAELGELLRLADENGLTVPKELRTAFEGDQGYWEEEAIMGLMVSEFGGPYSTWSIEQKHWFGEVMTAIGFREHNHARLPAQGDISCEEALHAAQARILADYGDDVSDATLWCRSIDYSDYILPDGRISAPEWEITFTPASADRSAYRLLISRAGEIRSLDVHAAPASGGSGDAVVEHFIAISDGMHAWSYETWANLGRELEACTADTIRSWLFQRAGYRLPPASGLSCEEARALALAAVGLAYSDTRSAVCCTDAGTAIWKIEILTSAPEDIGRGRYTAIHLVELDATTGSLRDKREFIVGGSIDPIITFIPSSLYGTQPDNLSDTPNG